MNNPMRMAIFADGLFPYVVGGMQKFTSLSVKHLAMEGVLCHVFYIEEPCYPAPDTVHREVFDDSAFVSLHPVVPPPRIYFPGHWYFTCWRHSAQLLNAYRNSRVVADLIYAHGYTGWRACQVRRAGGRNVPPVGVHAHGIEALQEHMTWWQSAKNTLAPVWQKRILQIADFNLSLGGALDDVIFAATRRRDNIVSAHNGIAESWLSLSSRAHSSPERVRFLFVGRDTVRKGFTELNAATKALLDKGSNFELDVVGPISPPNRLQHADVHYHGEIKDESRLKSIYDSCDVLLVPSYSEGMPTVILEAMASGLAVIATDVGGVRTAVDDRVGWIIAPRDVNQLMNAMKSVMDRDLTALRIAAFQRAHRFTWTSATRNFLSSLEVAAPGFVPSAGSRKP